MDRTQAMKDKPFDHEQWQKLYYRHQQQYIRNRLSAIHLLQQGNTRAQVCQQIGCVTTHSPVGLTSISKAD